ncbi:MAG: PHP domain-containing protein [Ferrovum sp.]|nr:PHP domain-containing protein [Ferrovum sp.]NDU86955.1 PHP domain-containing protein [Ferrovum sp.]
MQNIDLHNHSRVSDGLLAPAALVALAKTNAVTALALTDHDDLAGLEEARQAAQDVGIGFVPGVEVSVTWGTQTIHVVGLGIDENNPVLRQGLAELRQGRQLRAEQIAVELARAGIGGALEGARRFAHNPAILARPHFARYLVERGVARDVATVFRRFLVKGKPGYVRHIWTSLEEAISWIRAASGIPVLAHPGRYSLSRQELDRLLDEFVAAGGRGIEVVTGNHTREQVEYFAAQATKRGLLASRGSDYHGPGESRFEPGRMPPLPEQCVPVWTDLNFPFFS